MNQKMRKIIMNVMLAIILGISLLGCGTEDVSAHNPQETEVTSVESQQETDTEARETESAVIEHAPKLEPENSQLPTLRLYLEGTTLEEINGGSKSIKYDGNKATWEVNGEITSFENVQIKGRGNSTWDWPKKPYQVKFDEKVDILGMGKAKSWVLLANYRDVSLMRNEEAFYLSAQMGMECALDGYFVNFYVDDAYVGLYYMTHKVEVGSSVVDLEDDLGALVEVESGREPDDIAVYSKVSDTCLMLKEAVLDDDDDKRQAALDSFKVAFDRMEEAAKEGNWDLVKTEIDVESFVKYFLISEFSANPDAYVSSFYMYRDGDSDVIHAGPMWDFDSAFGNVKYDYGDATSPWRSWAYADPRDLVGRQSKMMIDLYQYLLDMPEFRAAVEECYRTEMKPILEMLPQYIDGLSVEIEKEALVDQKIWHEYTHFQSEVERLQNWNKSRTVYMDMLYGNREDLADGTYEVILGEVCKVWQFEKQNDGSYRILDGEGNVLGLMDKDSIVAGQAVTFSKDENTYGQRWFIVKDDDGCYHLVSKLTGLVLNISADLTVREYEVSMTGLEVQLQ